MRHINFLIVFLFLISAFSSQACAKNIFNSDSASVIALKQMTEAGRVVRSSDIPISKADVTADTKRAKMLKYKFYEMARTEFQSVEIKDVLKNPLLYKGLFE